MAASWQCHGLETRRFLESTRPFQDEQVQAVGLVDLGESELRWFNLHDSHPKRSHESETEDLHPRASTARGRDSHN